MVAFSVRVSCKSNIYVNKQCILPLLRHQYCGFWTVNTALSCLPICCLCCYSDYNECLLNNGNCSQTCVNEIPGFHCECESGHVLHPDRITCINNAECSGNTVENFTCQCLSGYLDVDGTGFNCTGQQKYIAQYCIISLHSMYDSKACLLLFQTSMNVNCQRLTVM